MAIIIQERVGTEKLCANTIIVIFYFQVLYFYILKTCNRSERCKANKIISYND